MVNVNIVLLVDKVSPNLNNNNIGSLTLHTYHVASQLPPSLHTA